LTIRHCILSAELIKTHSFKLLFGDFAHWDIGYRKVLLGMIPGDNRIIVLVISDLTYEQKDNEKNYALVCYIENSFPVIQPVCK